MRTMEGSMMNMTGCDWSSKRYRRPVGDVGKEEERG
jgi:hypothetical protein